MSPATEQQILNDLRDIKMAVIGDENLQVPGLVKRVGKLERWRRRFDLRVAGISGGAFTLFLLVKWLLEMALTHR